MPDIASYEVVPLSAFKDNYIWTLRRGRSAVIVDPGDPAPVEDYLAQQNLDLVAILATHHHADHVGGIRALTERRPCPVYGPSEEPIPCMTHPVGDGDGVVIDAIGARFDVLGIPGHTRAHVGYVGGGNLFCGDTLFACGCGRLFEGTAEQMYASLAKLLALPDETRVYCGHEYTLSNIAFAKAVEPGNPALDERAVNDRQLRDAGRPTLPSTLGKERATNPFLRCLEPPVSAAANKYLGKRMSDPVRVFAALRDWKNGF